VFSFGGDRRKKSDDAQISPMIVHMEVVFTVRDKKSKHRVKNIFG
jgi:hypothetical protein